MNYYKRVLTDGEKAKLSNQVATGFTAYNFFKLFNKLIDRIQTNACILSQNDNQIELSELTFGDNHTCFHCDNYLNSVTKYSFYHPFCFELTIRLILNQYDNLHKEDNISARLKQILFSSADSHRHKGAIFLTYLSLRTKLNFIYSTIDDGSCYEDPEYMFLNTLNYKRFLETCEKYFNDWEFLKIEKDYKEINFINVPISLGCFLDFILSKSPCDILRISHLSNQNKNFIFQEFLTQIKSYDEKKQFIEYFLNKFC